MGAWCVYNTYWIALPLYCWEGWPTDKLHSLLYLLCMCYVWRAALPTTYIHVYSGYSMAY